MATLQVVDVYDITDSVNQVWVDAFEPVASGVFGYCGRRFFQFAAQDASGGTAYATGAIALYDLSDNTLVPVSKTLTPCEFYGSWGIQGCQVTTLDADSGRLRLFRINRFPSLFTACRPGTWCTLNISYLRRPARLEVQSRRSASTPTATGTISIQQRRKD